MTTTTQGIRCGNRAVHGTDKVYHANADQVRACFQVQPAPTAPSQEAPEWATRLRRQHEQSRPFDRQAPRNADEVRTQQYRGFNREASPKSMQYLRDLAGNREWTDRVSAAVMRTIIKVQADAAVTLEPSEASAAIDQLKTCPRKSQSPEAKPSVRRELAALLEQVPNERYAVTIEDKVHFYVVKDARLQSGKVIRVVREKASDHLYRMTEANQVAALKAVLADGLERAGMLYATTLDECRRCGRDLTDTDNRYKVYGYGPDCGPKVMG
jgi:hypothetical protein